MYDNYGNNVSDMTGTAGGATDHTFAADLSRGAWDNVAAAPPVQQKPENQVLKDSCGHVTDVIQPDGTIYQYSKFQANGQPSEVMITDGKTGEYGQWKREEDGLWRSYNKDKPNYEVVYGEWVVDKNGMMHLQGRQDTKELPPQITRDAEGHITKAKHEDGTLYEYSKFDENGQPTVCKISDPKKHDWGYWKKEGDHLWRSYDKENPNYEVLKGDWTVDKNGTMHMNGVQDSMEKPPRSKNDAEGQPPSDSNAHVAHKRQIGPGPNGVPTSPPEGYRYLRSKVSNEIGAKATSLLGGAYGTETPFEIDGKKYLARVEPHPPSRKIDHWHKGVTVYEAK